MDDDLTNLRANLRAMPVPEPRRGFVDRVLENATQVEPAARARPVRAALRRPATWWAAGAGALAATLACVAILGLRPDAPRESQLTLALYESREVPLVIDSERDLEGATIRIVVAGSIALDGYDSQRELEWKASLTQGANLLSLPVVAREPGDGLVVAEIEHDGRTRRVSVAMRVSPAISFAPRPETPQDDSA